MSVRIAHWPRIRPTLPPIAASSRFSTNSCRSSRQRLAPRATRMPISRRRASARASITAATLAHAMARSKATATLSVDAAVRKSRTASSCSGLTNGETTLSVIAFVPDRLMRAQEILFALLGRHAGAETTDAFESVALPLLIRIAAERDPQARVARVDLGGARQHADDRVQLSAQLQRAPDRAGVAAEALLPQRFADDRDVRGVGFVLLGREHATQNGRDPEHVFHLVSHLRRRDALGARDRQPGSG